MSSSSVPLSNSKLPTFNEAIPVEVTCIERSHAEADLQILVFRIILEPLEHGDSFVDSLDPELAIGARADVY